MSKIIPGRTISTSAMERLYDPNFQDAIAEIIRIVNPLVDSRALIRTISKYWNTQVRKLLK